MRHGDDGGFQTESVGAGLVRRLMSLLGALVLQRRNLLLMVLEV
jgi:hypothetical protein